MRRLRYGPISAKVWHVGFADPHEIFRVVLEDREGRRFSDKIHVPFDPDDEPILDRIAVWRAIDELRGAVKEPDSFEGAAAEGRIGGEKGGRRARELWANSVVNAAFAFGEQVLDDAWGETLVEADRLEGRPWGREGPKEWFPGV